MPLNKKNKNTKQILISSVAKTKNKNKTEDIFPEALSSQRTSNSE